MKFFLLILFLLLLFCCQKSPLPTPEAEDICQQIKKRKIFDVQDLDSLIKSSEHLSAIDRTTILLTTLAHIKDKASDRDGKDYAHTAFRIVPASMKKECYLFLLEYFPTQFDKPELLQLFAELENKQRLSTLEQVRLLNAKSSLFMNTYREYPSALYYQEKALEIARKHNLYEEEYKILYKRITFDNNLLNNSKLFENIQKCMTLVETHPSLQKHKERLQQLLAYYYYSMGKYHEALEAYKKTKPVKRYLLDIYTQLDSTQQALSVLRSMIEDNRFPNPAHYNFAYYESQIWKKANNLLRYEQSLKTSIRYQDSCLAPDKGVGSPLIFEARCEYAALLWEKGKSTQAIECLEKILPIALKNFHKQIVSKRNSNEYQRAYLKQLIGYYQKNGDYEKAENLRPHIDSLQSSFQQQLIDSKIREFRSVKLTQELGYSLEIQKREYERESSISLLMKILLILSISVIVLLVILYRRRQHQLDLLYKRQKEIEQLESCHEPTTEDSPTPLTGDEQLFRNIKKTILENKLFLHPDFSRDNLCREVGSNRSYVSTCINKYAGMNLNQWINKIRIDYAISLIHQGETNLSILASSSGFSSASSFFRSFKQFTLLTPKQYIEREQKRNRSHS